MLLSLYLHEINEYQVSDLHLLRIQPHESQMKNPISQQGQILVNLKCHKLICICLTKLNHKHSPSTKILHQISFLATAQKPLKDIRGKLTFWLYERFSLEDVWAKLCDVFFHWKLFYPFCPDVSFLTLFESLNGRYSL